MVSKVVESGAAVMIVTVGKPWEFVSVIVVPMGENASRIVRDCSCGLTEGACQCHDTGRHPDIFLHDEEYGPCCVR
jgi:hypothetical protein